MDVKQLAVSPWIWCAAVALIAGVTGLVAAILRFRRNVAVSAPEQEVVPELAVEPVPVLRKTQKISTVYESAVTQETLDALRHGKDIQTLNLRQLQEVLDDASVLGLHEITDDVLREKITRCALGSGISKLLPVQADVIWGCVLSWDPPEEDLEKQATDIFSWACADCGTYDAARPVVEHSRHNIPLPDQIPMSGGSEAVLVFDRKLSTLLDEGASASVFKAHVEGHRDLAVKISRLTGYGILRNTLLEYMLLRRAQGIETVIRLYAAGCYHVKGEIYFFIVEELAQTTLAGEYERRKASKTPFTEKELRDCIVKPFLDGLVKLHRRGIIHRDLKPKNIYLVDGVFKIGDFEIAVYSGHESLIVNSGTFAGTPAYTTAGALVGRYGPDTDINALACISFMTLRGDLPAIEDAPGTSTLVRGIKGGSTLTNDDKLRQEKAKKAVQEWLAQKRGFVTQIMASLKSSPFERFFVAPIMSQGLYAEPADGAIMTAADAMKALERIELSEEAQETRKKALELARGGDFDPARRMLVDFDARLHRRTKEEIEVSMRVMLGDVLKEIDQIEIAGKNHSAGN